MCAFLYNCGVSETPRTLFGIPIKVVDDAPPDTIALGYAPLIQPLTAAEAAENFQRFAESFLAKYPGGLVDAWGLDIASRLK
jgi:hypothetical protein